MSSYTIQDVAREARVSVATVSRVINNSHLVTDKTREIVLEAVNKLNYLPNLLGRNLRRTETKLILVLIPSIANPFYSKIVKGIEDTGHINGYNIMLCSTDMEVNREREYLDLLKNRLADGIIFMAPVLSKEELTYIGMNFPVVQCCEYNEDANVSHITIDNFSAAYKAAKHLINLGHKRIGIISSENSFHSTSQREAGFKKAIEDSGATLDNELIVYGDYGFNSGLKAANQLLSLESPPSAIFSISDIMAIGAIRAIIDKGLKIPEDIAVVGFDNISFSSMCNPTLTTISQPKYDLGRIAMELLIKLIKGEHTEPQKINLETELIIRESTKKRSNGMKKIKVTVWNEYLHEVKDATIGQLYPKGIHGAIAEFLGEESDFEIRTATLSEPEHGLTDEVLSNTDVLIWWGHQAHQKVKDEIVEKIHNRVLCGMGLIVLHSAHMSKIFTKLMGTSCTLKWREIGESERLWVIEPTHPIAEGIGEYVDIEHEEMYGERFDIPTPDALVFAGWFKGGELFRSGCCFNRGYGKVFYFQPGHETYPVYYQKEIQKIIKNAVRWSAPLKELEKVECSNPEPLEKIIL